MTSSGSSSNSNEDITLRARASRVEFRTKKGALAGWAEAHMHLKGKWLILYKAKNDPKRLGCMEIGEHIEIESIIDSEISKKFPRRFDVLTKGGFLDNAHWFFRFTKKSERDAWVEDILHNARVIASVDISIAIPNYSKMMEVANHLHQNLNMEATRLKSLKKVVNCVKGQDIFNYFISHGYVQTEEEALRLGNKLMMADLIQHALLSKDFLNNSEPYVFPSIMSTRERVDLLISNVDTRKYWLMIQGGEAVDPRVSTMSTLHMDSSSLASSPSMNTRSTTSSTNSGDIITSAMNEGPYLNPRNVSKCMICQKKFGALRRKHRCSLCSDIVCTHCGPTRDLATLSGDTVKSRVCLKCTLQNKSTVCPAPSVFNSSSGVSHSTATSSSSVSSSPHSSSASASSHVSKQHSGTSLTRSLSSSSGSTVSSKGSCIDCDDECLPMKSHKESPYPLDFSWKFNWPRIPPPTNDEERIEVVKRLNIIGTEPNEAFDKLAFMASVASKCRVALIGFFDDTQFWCKSALGFNNEFKCFREEAMGLHTLLLAKPIVCLSTKDDVRYRSYPLVKNKPHMLFYGSYPLIMPSGHIVGVIDVMDTKKRTSCQDILPKLGKVAEVVVNLLVSISEESKTESRAVKTTPSSPVVRKSPPPPPVRTSHDTKQRGGGITLFPTSSFMAAAVTDKIDEESDVEDDELTTPKSVTTPKSLNTPKTTPPTTPSFIRAPTLHSEDLVEACIDSSDEDEPAAELSSWQSSESESAEVEDSTDDNDNESVEEDTILYDSASKIDSLKEGEVLVEEVSHEDDDFGTREYIEHISVSAEKPHIAVTEDDVMILTEEHVASEQYEYDYESNVNEEQYEVEEEEEEEEEEEVEGAMIPGQPQPAVAGALVAPAAGGNSMEMMLADMFRKQQDTAAMIANQQVPMIRTINEHGEKLKKLTDTLGRMEAALTAKVTDKPVAAAESELLS